MAVIRRATRADACRIAEIEIFNYRLNFYPIFRSDEFYFGELQVVDLMQKFLDEPGMLENTYVYDDGVVKGFIRLEGTEIRKLFVEPVLQGRGIGEALLKYAVEESGARKLWALEKNTRAIAFYGRHGFLPNGEKKYEDDTTEFLIMLERQAAARA